MEKKIGLEIRSYETREDVGAIKRFIRREISWSTVRIPLSLLLAVVLWHLLTTFQAPVFRHIPKPMEVLNEAINYVPTAKFWTNVLHSNKRVLSGLLAAMAIGIPLGLAMGYRRAFNEYTFAVFEVVRPIPPIAWLPLSVLMFPTPEMSITYLVFLGAFFPITLNTLLGVAAVEENYRRAALSLGATPRDVFRHVILPGATPSIFAGVLIGAGMTWDMVIAAEMIAGGYGLGYMTWDAYVILQFPRIIFGMISIGLCGLALSTLVRFIGSKIMPWRQSF
ncbi:MAG: Bicarbonate transport system permease protein CmpB [Syntrophomonadaceae bacterium]|nr:Bicarbonate transport system permease protein CmpB [Bacillota bacterium]